MKKRQAKVLFFEFYEWLADVPRFTAIGTRQNALSCGLSGAATRKDAKG